MHLLIPVVVAAFAPLGVSPRYPAATPDAVWALLPREDPPLPAWARVLAPTLPRATGSMLELDAMHRASNPVGSALAAKLRWTAADALGCEYGRVTSLADLKRAGASADDVRRLTEGKPNDDEKQLLAFARQLTTAAYLVTDEQFAAVLKQLGPEKTTAAVHTVAFANFQFRVIMALGVKPEPDGPVPPLAVKLDRTKRAKVPAPPRPDWETVTAARPKKAYDAPADWKDVSFDQLEEALAAQKVRTPRVPLPGPDRFKNLPPDAKRQTDTIVWMTVSTGYQPAMTRAWFEMLNDFRADGRLDRVFGSTLFWVVTRANDCFY